MESNVKISFIDADSPVNLKMQKITIKGTINLDEALNKKVIAIELEGEK